MAKKMKKEKPKPPIRFFAGGELPQEEKDKFLKAMNKAYIRCREEAEKRGGEE